ncbi:unnamed protein product [Caenorhabditis brenneri]
MAGYFLTSDKYDNLNPPTGYNLFADAHYKKIGLKTQNEKRGRARKAWETHLSPKRLQSPYRLFVTQKSKKIRDAERMQMCSIFAKRLSVTWKHMIEKEKKPYYHKNQIKIKKPLEFISWTLIEPTFNAADCFPWAKILRPDGLGTPELDRCDHF